LKTYIANAWEYYWVLHSNKNPNQEINDRVKMKLVDYLWSSKGRENKRSHGVTVLNHRLCHLKELHCVDFPCKEAEEEALIQTSNKIIQFYYCHFGNHKSCVFLHSLRLHDMAKLMNC
jgi:hypothetical protein